METINHEYFVSLEVAKLLKEVGFNWECRKIYYKDQNADNWYLEDNHMHHRHILQVDYSLLAPTLDVTQRWLREVKDISVDISSTRYSEWEYIIRKINQVNHNDNTIFALTACRFYTYEEVQEAGEKKALELILEKGE